MRQSGDGVGTMGFGGVSRRERHAADRFYADLLGRTARPLGPPRARDRLREPPAAEHQTTGLRPLRAGAVGPAVDGTRGVAADIALVSPSGALRTNTLASIQGMSGTLARDFTAAGHQVAFRLAPNEPSPVFTDADYRLAGTDAQRSASLHFGLFDGGLSAAIAIRGGHGATRVLDELADHITTVQARHWPRIPPLRKLFPPRRLVGFSDFTAVLLAAYNLLGWAGLHGPMLSATGGAASRTELVRALTLNPGALYANNLVRGNLTHAGGRRNTVRGVMIGGNLALVDALFGSPFFPSLEGALLFVEETGEQGRKIDRMIEGLKHRGAARQARAVVVGQITDSAAAVTPDAVARLFHRSWGVPCVSGLQAGHGTPNMALWLGLEYELRFPAAGGAELFLIP